MSRLDAGDLHTPVTDHRDSRASIVAAPLVDHGVATGGRLRRSGRNWAVVAVVLCPCHLPMVIAVLGAVGFANASRWLGSNALLVGAGLAPAAAISLWVAVSAARTAAACPACDRDLEPRL